MISFVTGEENVSDQRRHDKQEDLDRLVKYLSGLTLKEGEEEELKLPDEELPTGFHIIPDLRRSYRRKSFSYDEDFTIIVLKEMKSTSEGKHEDTVKIMFCFSLLSFFCSLLLSLFLSFLYQSLFLL